MGTFLRVLSWFVLSFLLVSQSRADYIDDPNAGRYYVDFSNSSVGMDHPAGSNNFTLNYIAGTATLSGSTGKLTT